MPRKSINEMFFMRPWAMKEDVLTSLTEIVLRHMSGQKLSESEIESRTGADKKVEPPDYAIDANGLARIPVYGVIAKRANMVNGISKPRGTSVEEIRNDFLAAMDDPAVKAIALDVDSPGGSVDGIAELSDVIFNARGKKPITAYTNGQMASAAYWIGSSADKIYASKSAEVGSIGVYAVIHDYSRAVKNEGIDTVVFKAGKYKAAGNPYKQMTEDDQAAIQDTVNSYYDLFIEGVARNRGLNADAALKLANGKTYIGKKALDIGLIDGLQNIDEVFACNNDDSKNKKAEAVPRLVKCMGCKNEFDYLAEPETAMGAVKCPKCGDVVDQTGAVLVEGKKTKEEGSDMEIKDLTLDIIKSQRPDLAKALIEESKTANATAVEMAVKAEKDRCSGIMNTAKVYADVEGIGDIVKTSIESSDSIVASENKFKDKKIAVMEASSNKGPGADQGDIAMKTHLEKAREYAAANKCSLTVALKATAPKRAKA